MYARWTAAEATDMQHAGAGVSAGDRDTRPVLRSSFAASRLVVVLLTSFVMEYLASVGQATLALCRLDVDSQQ